MVKILAMLTALSECGRFGEVRAEALFASSLQPSGSPSSDQVRQAVATMLRRRGVRGCAARMAGESSTTAAADLRSLAFAD